MPIGMASEVGRGMGVLDGGAYHQREGGNFGVEFGGSNCNFAMRLFQNYFGQYLL